MASALTPTGSTHQWRQLRAAWAERIAEAGSWPCWRCPDPILPGMRWCLGHTTDRALGGTDDHLAPEHKRCSDSSGGRLGNTLRKARTTHRRTPSRSW